MYLASYFGKLMAEYVIQSIVHVQSRIFIIDQNYVFHAFYHLVLGHFGIYVSFI